MTTEDLLSAGRVDVAQDGAVAHVTFSHPKGNSLPGAVLRALADTIRRLGEDPAVRAIVLRSEGATAFCGGASFDELRAIRDEQQGREFFSGFAHVILAMRSCPKVVIARVHGKAVGGGVGLVAAADYAFAVPNASVRLSELAIGIGPFVVGPVVERRIGTGAFAAMSIDAEWHDAAWADRHGLFSRVVDGAPALDAVVPAFAARLAAASPDAVSALKRVLWEGTEHWETLLYERAAISGRLVLTDFARRAIESVRAT
jgi:methylglutaconyl-CoA hydratase